MTRAVQWQTNADGSKTCSAHGETFRAPAACAQCDTDDARDDGAEVNESFPRTAAALARAAAHHMEMHRRFMDREDSAHQAAAFTAAAAYGRLALSSLTAACERLEKIAERLDIDALAKSRSTTRRRSVAAATGVQ